VAELIVIIVSGVLVNNFVLTKFLGLCPFLGATTRLETALGMSLATTFVLTLSSAASYLLEVYVLAPLGLEWLRLISFMLVIAGAVQFTELLIRSSSPILHQVLGIYLPLITTNCAVLGVALLNIQKSQSFLQAIAYGIGAGMGFCLVMLLFAGIRERLDTADVPTPFRGAAIALVTAGLMSLGFMGFAGIARG
jgi:electron transport complex protein RnfA